MIPGYLRKNWGESRKRKVIKLGNEIRESKYSKDEQKKKWRLCKTERWRPGGMCGRNAESGERNSVANRRRWIGC